MSNALSKLGNLVRIRTGKLDANASAPDGKFPFFTCAREPLRISTYSYDCECVLVAGNGDLNVKYYNGKFDAYQRTYIVESLSAEVLDVRYLYHFMDTYLDKLRHMSIGGVIKYIKIGNLTEAELPLPCIADQRRISAILDQADALRVKRREALAQLDSLTRSIFIEMFGDPVVNPMHWECRSLDEVTNKVTDGEHINPKFVEFGMPIVMAGNVLVDQIDLDAAKRVETTLGQQFRKKCCPEFGDLLIVGRGATIGRLCRVNVYDSFCLMGSVILVKPDRSLLDERYLSGMLAMPSMHAMLYKTSGSSAQQAIYLKDVKKLSCPIPPISLQQGFSTRIQAVEALKAAHRISLSELDSLFASLQHSAFQGKL